MTTETAPTQHMTILRIKRKRTDEPLDALYLEQAKKARKEHTTSISTVYRFAHTLNEATFNDVATSEQLKQRIATLAKSKQQRRQDAALHPPTVRSRSQRQASMQHRPSTTALRFHVVQQKLNSDKARRTAKANLNRSIASVQAEMEANEIFRVFDAVQDTISTTQPKILVDESDPNASDIMCNFIPMLKEYLTLNEDTPANSSATITDTEEYVYDIYYKAEDEFDDTLDTASKPRNVASLAWFDDDDPENHGLVNDETDSDYDQEDEDSNAEDYYRNDYPDDELEDDEGIYNSTDDSDDFDGMNHY